MRPRRASRASLGRGEEEDELEQLEEEQPPRRQGRRAGKGKCTVLLESGRIPHWSASLNLQHVGTQRLSVHVCCMSQPPLPSLHLSLPSSTVPAH